MTDTVELARELRDAYRRYGERAVAPGATEADLARIKEAFADLGFPLPDTLIDVYRVTMGIPGLLNTGSLLVTPFDCCDDDVLRWLNRLDVANDDAYRTHVLHLGFGNEADLLIDRDGQCGTELDFPDTGYALRLADPTDFPTAFSRFVRVHLAEIEDEYGAATHGD